MKCYIFSFHILIFINTSSVTEWEGKKETKSLYIKVEDIRHIKCTISDPTGVLVCNNASCCPGLLSGHLTIDSFSHYLPALPQ